MVVKLTIGISREATYVLPSNNISVVLMVIKFKDTKWTIKDIKSFNGIFLNGYHLIPCKKYRLKERDSLQFGYSASSPDQPAAYSYRFYSCLLDEHVRTIIVRWRILKTKEDALIHFVETLGEHVVCAICSEYLIKATILNCTHVFCNLCIRKWMKVKKVCPNCRAPITSLGEVPVLDHCIDSMIKQLDDEAKKSRRDLLAQRKIEQGKFDRTNSALMLILKFLNIKNENVVDTAFRTVEQAEVAARSGMSAVRTFTRTQVPTPVSVVMNAEALTMSAVWTGAKVLKRSKAATKAAGAAVLRNAAAVTKAARSAVKQAARSAIFRRAAAITKATACAAGADKLKKIAMLRHAAALTKTASTIGVKQLTKMSILKKAAAIMQTAALQKSQLLTKAKATRKAVALTKAVAHKMAGVFPESTLRKAKSLTSAAVMKAAALKRVYSFSKIVKLVKTAALRKAASIKRMAALIRQRNSSQTSASDEPVPSPTLHEVRMARRLQRYGLQQERMTSNPSAAETSRPVTRHVDNGTQTADIGPCDIEQWIPAFLVAFGVS